MKHRIPIEQVRLGMYVVAFEGSWFRHPFWRARFLLDDPADLAKIRDSGIDALVIDDALGAAPERAPEAVPPARAPAEAAPAARPVAAPVSRLLPDSDAERAADIVHRAKRVVGKLHADARRGRAVDPAEAEPVVAEIAESVARDAAAMVRAVGLKKKGDYSCLHSIAVCALMINLARQMRLDEATVRDLGMAGLFHDLGKAAIPTALLDKPGPLDERERRQVRRHPQLGHALLQQMPDLTPIALDVCLHHHERVDGTGYPFGLSGDALSRYARMAAVCDVYDAITSRRPYKEAWTPSDALAQMLTWDGQFDRDVLDDFIRSIGIFPVGTLVRLRSNRLGLVIGANNRTPTLPLVRAFYSAIDETFMPLETFSCSETLKGDGIVGLEASARWFGTRWPAIESFILDDRLPPAMLHAAEAEQISTAVFTPQVIGGVLRA